MPLQNVNSLGWKIAFGAVDEEQFLTNFVVCPPALYVTLASIANRLEGLPAKELNTLLQSDFCKWNMSMKSERGIEIKKILDCLKNVSPVIFGLFHGPELDLEYKKAIKKTFQTTFIDMDFSDPYPATAMANAWVTLNTEGYLKEAITDEFTEETQFVAVNLLISKMEWYDQFDPSKTELETFYVDKETTIDVPLMVRQGLYSHYRSETKKMAVTFIPYKQDGLLAIFIRPDARTLLMKVAKKLKVFIYLSSHTE